MMTWSNGNISRVTGPLCGYSPVTGEFPAQRPMARGFDVLFDLRLNKRLSKQAKRRWFYTPSRSYDVTAMISRYKIQHPYLGFHIDEVPTDFVYSWARRYKVWTAICIPDIGQNFIEVPALGRYVGTVLIADISKLLAWQASSENVNENGRVMDRIYQALSLFVSCD